MLKILWKSSKKLLDKIFFLIMVLHENPDIGKYFGE
jgi:hypothetical protein